MESSGVADFKDVVYAPPSFISAKWTIPSSTALPGYLQEVAAKHFETLQLTLRIENWFFPLKDMGCRLQNRSWGMWRILPLKLSLSPIQWFVFSNLHSFFCRLVNLTLRPCFSRVLGISIQTRNPRVRDILQSDPLTDASRSWPPISTSPKWYRSRQYTYDTMAFWCRRSSLSIESPKTKESRISTQKVEITITQSHLIFSTFHIDVS